MVVVMVVIVADPLVAQAVDANYFLSYKTYCIIYSKFKMKKYIFLLISGFSIGTVQSQEIADAIRYSQDNLNGTARFRSMGGAFGALGGDLSSININPAGSAVFNNNQAGLTLSSFNTKNNSNYFGTTTSASENTLDLNQTGGVFVFKNQNQNSNWKKFSVAVNYENTNNFDNFSFSAGRNPNNSLANYFVSYANGVSLGALENSSYRDLNYAQQQAYLGYHAYVINPAVNSLDNTNYNSNVTSGGNYYQENRVYSSGYSGKLSFNAATSYKDKLYVGVNLNSHFTNFSQSSSFYESNTNPLGEEYTVNSMRFNNNIYTTGSGFSFQLGAIAKVTNEIRLGFAYDSPIWYNMYDQFSQNLVATSANTSEVLAPNVVNPQVINYYSPYKLDTPSKYTGSFAYIFGKNALISIDYSLKDYSSTKFRPQNDSYYRELNNEMSSTLKTSGELRIGAEYKIKEWSLRGGYRFEESPYKDSTTVGDLNAFSGGLGYNFGLFKLDFSYTNAQKSSQQAFFSQGFTDSAKINSTNNNYSVTLLFEM